MAKAQGAQEEKQGENEGLKVEILSTTDNESNCRQKVTTTYRHDILALW